MSALDSLLGPRLDPLADPSTPSPRTLLVGGDVLIHLQENASREEVIFYSVPGRLERAGWFSERAEAWIHAVPHPTHAGVTALLAIEPHTGDVFLVDVWPRALLNDVAFGQHIDEHSNRHRHWRANLQSAIQSDRTLQD